MRPAAGLEVQPATPDRWDDVAALAGDNGFYSGCWCSWWLLSSAAFDRASTEERRAVLQDLVAEGAEPGLLAYRDGEPVGWVALGPRERYGRLQRSPKLKPVDDTPVWVVNCFVVRRDQRGAGVATALLEAAVAHARARGATHLEGVPIDTGTRGTKAAAALYTGVLSTFESAGFVEVGRRGGRPIVRRHLEGAPDQGRARSRSASPRRGTAAAAPPATASTSTPARSVAPSATAPTMGGPARNPR